MADKPTDESAPEETSAAAPEQTPAANAEAAPVTEAPAGETAEPEVRKPKATKKIDKEAGESAVPAAPAEGEKAAKPAKKKAAAKVEAPAENKPDPLDLDTIEQPKIVKAKGSKNISNGIAHVQATFNNTIVTVTDSAGNLIGWSSGGKCGFRGSRKSTAYAAQMVAQDACRQAMGHGLREVEVRVKGPGAGRESAVRAIQAIGLEISVIRDVTPVPHNGCRPPKQRRV